MPHVSGGNRRVLAGQTVSSSNFSLSLIFSQFQHNDFLRYSV